MKRLDDKGMLHRYLEMARDTLLWKLEGVSEYDARRPLTPSGTNLLGLVKHLAVVEFGYFGDTFDRPHDERFAWDDRDQAPDEDMFATADEQRCDIVALYHRATAHADRTIAELPLDHPGRVPWWPDDVNPVTLHRIMVHMIAETHRHAGHADIAREMIDGAIGHRRDVANLPDTVEGHWFEHRARVEAAAQAAADRVDPTG